MTIPANYVLMFVWFFLNKTLDNDQDWENSADKIIPSNYFLKLVLRLQGSYLRK